MLEWFTYFKIIGLPLIVWIGIITFICLIITAAIPISNKRGWTQINLQWHFRFAYTSIGLAVIHGFLGIMTNF